MLVNIRQSHFEKAHFYPEGGAPPGVAHALAGCQQQFSAAAHVNAVLLAAPDVAALQMPARAVVMPFDEDPVDAVMDAGDRGMGNTRNRGVRKGRGEGREWEGSALSALSAL